MHANICMHTYVHTHTHLYIYTYTQKHTQRYTYHTYTHLRIHTHKLQMYRWELRSDEMVGESKLLHGMLWSPCMGYHWAASQGLLAEGGLRHKEVMSVQLAEPQGRKGPPLSLCLVLQRSSQAGREITRNQEQNFLWSPGSSKAKRELLLWGSAPSDQFLSLGFLLI